MGRIQKMKAGTWRAGSRDLSGTCKSRTFKLKIEAEKLGTEGPARCRRIVRGLAASGDVRAVGLQQAEE